MVNTREYLEDWEREVVSFVERYHAVSGSVPDDNEILEFVNNFTETEETVSLPELEELKNDFLFQESMRVRGIIIDESSVNSNLTPRQMAAVAAMLNLIDKRSDEKKLRDLGITTEEWSTWMLNDKFSAYVTGRAEKLINNPTAEAHLGLLKGVRAGNLQAVKLHYEITGRYNPEQENAAVNVSVLLARVLETIQKHVRDPNTLNALGSDLMQLGIESRVSPVAMQVGPKIIKQLEP